MEVLWTTAVYAVFAGGLAVTAHILWAWLRASRH